MGSVPSIRLYEHGDEQEVVPLLESAFDGWPKFDLDCTPLDYWRWKNLENPSGVSLSYVSVIDEKVVGVTHETYQRLKFLDLAVMASQGVDNAVDVNYRRMGLSKTMYDMAMTELWRRGVKFFYYNTGNKHLIDFTLTMPETYQPAPIPVSSLVRINDLNRHFELSHGNSTWVEKAGYSALSIMKKVATRRVSVEGTGDIEVRLISEFDSRFDDFWEEVKYNYVYIVERSREYLNWRYCDPRGGSFRVLVAERGGELLGYIVLRINRINEEYPVGFVMDFLSRRGEASAMLLLAESAVDFFDENGVNIIQCHSVKNSVYSKALGRYGFLDSRRKTYTFFAARDGFDELLSLRNYSTSKLHFATGDLDFI